MWIKAGRYHFNSNNLAYIQVALQEDDRDVKSVHLHFINERDNFTLHGQEASTLLASIEALGQESGRELLTYDGPALAIVRQPEPVVHH